MGPINCAPKPYALARSRRRYARFLLARKPDLPSQEDQQDSMCVKEVENTSLFCGSNRDLESLDNPTPATAAYWNGQSFLNFWPKQLIVTIMRKTR